MLHWARALRVYFVQRSLTRRALLDLYGQRLAGAMVLAAAWRSAADGDRSNGEQRESSLVVLLDEAQQVDPPGSCLLTL